MALSDRERAQEYCEMTYHEWFEIGQDMWVCETCGAIDCEEDDWELEEIGG